MTITASNFWTAMLVTASNFWTAMLVIYGFCAVVLLGVWLLTRRAIRRSQIRRASPTGPIRRSPPPRKSTSCWLARCNDRGDFGRAVVRRVPSDLFVDDLILECGHASGTSPRGEEVARAN